MSRAEDIERARSWFSGAEGYEGPGDAEALADLIARIRTDTLEAAAKTCEAKADATGSRTNYLEGMADGYNRAARDIRALKDQ